MYSLRFYLDVIFVFGFTDQGGDQHSINPPRFFCSIRLMLRRRERSGRSMALAPSLHGCMQVDHEDPFVVHLQAYRFKSCRRKEAAHRARLVELWLQPKQL